MKQFVPHDREAARPAYIYRAWVTNRAGKKIYASNYGLRAFRIRVR